MLRQKNIISQAGYGRGRAGHSSRGESLSVEFQGERGYSGSGKGWVPQMLRQKNIISQAGYGRGRAGHSSRGESLSVEFQVLE
ncbi:hypothetical protein GOBAR_AA37992 [Gossypium barbadense]|uniref:Uncharacterized protein n=1 Tax=Gossypium barbadense TaxID=3634 RepID=A0A2P5VV57_GOSBA|nr:hypothetical protein GOBAR_AA37992 [Gossypium barbadense]